MDPVVVALHQKGAESVKSALRDVHDAIVAIDAASVASLAAGQRASKVRISALRTEAALIKKMSGERGGSNSPISRAMGGGLAEKMQRASTGPKLAESAGNGTGIGNLIKAAGAAGAAFAVLKSSIDMTVSALSSFGGYLIADIVKPAFALDKFAVQLENASGGSIKSQEVMDKSRAAQLRWNIDAMDAAQAASKLTDETGNAKVAFDSLNVLGMLAQGYGAEISDLSGLASAMYNSGMKDIQGGLFKQLAQGQIEGGRFTIKDISHLGGGLMEQNSRFSSSMSAENRLSSLGAALQTGGITGKADVSLTNMNSFLKEASSKMRTRHADLFDKSGGIKDLGAVLRAVLIDSKGDSGKLKSAGFSDTSSAFVMQYMGKFQEALAKGASIKDAAEQTLSGFEKMRNATMSEADVKAAATKVMMTSGERMASAQNAIKDKLMGLMPQISTLVNSLSNKAPQIASAAMMLARVFLALAEVLEKLIPETDTRTKRAFAKEKEKFELAEKAGKTGKELDAVDDDIAKVKAEGKDGKRAAELPGLEEKRARLKAQLVQDEAKIAKLDAPEEKEDPAKLIEKMVAAGKSDSYARNIIRGMQEDPTAYDVNSGGQTEDLPQTVKDSLSKYRDEQITRQEETIKGGVKHLDFTETQAGLDALTAALKKAAASGNDANRKSPLTER